jgi:uncharacterized protein YoxC
MLLASPAIPIQHLVVTTGSLGEPKLIARAQADLASGRIQDAGATLAVADDSITALAMATATPLPQARLSLQQAAKNYADDAYETAKANVHRAIGALQRAAEKGDEKARQDLQYLLEQASQLQSKIDKKEASVSHELSHLVQWVQALSERAMEQLSSAWSELRHRNSPAQSDLIEAKLHLGYAEADQLTAGSLSGAKLQLKEAQRYLDLAAKEADAAHQSQIDGIRQKLQQLMAKVDKPVEPDTQTLTTQYDDLLRSLRQLIQAMNPLSPSAGEGTAS